MGVAAWLAMQSLRHIARLDPPQKPAFITAIANPFVRHPNANANHSEQNTDKKSTY
jgi:hypothetical protein